MARHTDVFVPTGGNRQWPFAFQASLPNGVPRWKPYVFALQGLLRGFLGKPHAKPAAMEFWQSSPRKWLTAFMRADGAGKEHPSRNFVASLISPGESVLDAGCGTGVDYEVLAGGWHGWRASLTPDMIRLPEAAELRQYRSDAELDASNPRTLHYLDELVRSSGSAGEIKGGDAQAAHDVDRRDFAPSDG